jgi:hypothetical protein
MLAVAIAFIASISVFVKFPWKNVGDDRRKISEYNVHVPLLEIRLVYHRCFSSDDDVAHGQSIAISGSIKCWTSYPRMSKRS